MPGHVDELGGEQPAAGERRPVLLGRRRLELRHDASGAPIYFKAADVIPDARRQNTALLGATAWF